MPNILRRHRRIAIDSCIFIYQLQANERYLPLTEAVFAWLEAPGHMAVTSTITWTEILVPAYREANQQRLQRYVGLLATYPNLHWMAPELDIADMAAQLRARHALRTPDALQAATAIRAGATLFVTNDRGFRRVQGLESLTLDDIL